MYPTFTPIHPRELTPMHMRAKEYFLGGKDQRDQRQDKLRNMSQWVVRDRCRAVPIVPGMRFSVTCSCSCALTCA